MIRRRTATCVVLVALTLWALGCREEYPGSAHSSPMRGVEDRSPASITTPVESALETENDKATTRALQHMLNIFAPMVQHTQITVDGKKSHYTREILTAVAEHIDPDAPKRAENAIEDCAAISLRFQAGPAERAAHGIMCLILGYTPTTPPLIQFEVTDRSGSPIALRRVHVLDQNDHERILLATDLHKEPSWLAGQSKVSVSVLPEDTSSRELGLWVLANVRQPGSRRIVLELNTEVGPLGTAVTASDLQKILGAEVMICNGKCSPSTSDAKPPTLGAIARDEYRVVIGSQTWTTPGMPTAFEDLAHLYCAPKMVSINRKYPFHNQPPGLGRCGEYGGHHSAQTLTDREAVALILSFGPGWQGSGDTYAWYERLTQAGSKTIDALAHAVGTERDVAVYKSLPPAPGETRVRVKFIATARLDSKRDAYIEVMRRTHASLRGWPPRAPRWNEISGALRAMEQTFGGGPGLASVVVFTSDPGDGTSCNPVELEARGVPVIVAWTYRAGNLNCAQVAPWAESPEEWVEGIAHALAEHEAKVQREGSTR